MIDFYVSTMIFAVCMAGCGLSSFYLGRREGIESTVQYLIDQGVIDIDDEEF